MFPNNLQISTGDLQMVCTSLVTIHLDLEKASFQMIRVLPNPPLLACVFFLHINIFSFMFLLLWINSGLKYGAGLQ